MKNFYKMIRIHREIKVADQSCRFNAPHLKSLAGKPLVLNVEQERDFYFENLKAYWG